MDLIWWTGAIVWVALALVVAALICHVVGNIYGGIKGALRLYRVREQKLTWQRIKLAIRLGFFAWLGKRYRNGVGTYWRVNGLIVPCDGRDPIQRDRIPG